MPVSESQRAAYTRYRAAGKIGQINMSVTRAALEDIAEYARSKGMRPAECARDCIRRCMALDGWRNAGPDTAGVDAKQAPANMTGWRGGAAQPAQLAADQGTALPGGAAHDESQPPKRKRGRPRKNPAE